MAAKFRMNKRPHDGWQEGKGNWDLWYAFHMGGDIGARDALFDQYVSQCTRILAKHVTYVDQKEQSREDALQESAILMLTIMGEFNPMRAESFKAYIISFGTKRAVDVARTRSVIPRRVREATAIYNEAREQMAAQEGFLRTNNRGDMSEILAYAVRNGMWPQWLGNPTVEKVTEAIGIRDRGLSEYSLDTMVSTGTGDDDGRTRESVLARVNGHEDSVVKDLMTSNLREILDFILALVPEHDREVLVAFTDEVVFTDENVDTGRVGGVDGVKALLGRRAQEGGISNALITNEQAAKALDEARTSARTAFIAAQDDILVRDSDDELLEIIHRYLLKAEVNTSVDRKRYKEFEEVTLC